MPEMAGDEMVQCDTCDVWYHQHCMDIQSEVFGDSDVPGHVETVPVSSARCGGMHRCRNW